jgi:hypothetical protein
VKTLLTGCLTALMLGGSWDGGASAQFATPVIDGSIASGEYGVHTDGQNQQTSGSQVWYMTWDASNLYVGLTAASTAEGAVLYVDAAPVTPVNGGTNADGTLTGFLYDNTSFSDLQFRADLVVYFKDGYQEYRTADGANGWTAATAGFGSYASTGGTDRELAIPWSAIGGMPASFAWFAYVTSSGGFVYGQIPVENGAGLIGTAAREERYYPVGGTSDGASVKPFSRNSYVFNRATDAAGFGVLTAYDVTMNSPGRTITRAAGGGGGWTIGGSLRIDAGTVDFGSSTTTAAVTGDVTIGSSGSLLLSSAAGGELELGRNWTGIAGSTFTPNGRTVTLNGTGAQSISGAATFDALLVNSAGPVTLSNDIAVSLSLTLTGGVLATGTNKVSLAAGATVARTTGHVHGALEKAFAAGMQTFSWPIGDAFAFTPVQLDNFDVTIPGSVTARSTGGADHSSIATSGIDPLKSVNRSWTLTKDPGLAFTAYDPTFTFDPADIDVGANTAAFRLARYDGGVWNSTTTGLRTATSTGATGVTSFSDFAAGEPATYTITASITGNGSITPSGAVTAAWGTDTTFTVAPAANHHVDSLVVDGVNLGPLTTHTFTNITTGHTIAAYVSIDTWTISASSTGNGSIAPSGAVTVPHGTDTTFAITPAVGWHVDSVLVDGVDAGAVLSYTFTGVVAGHTITAYFSIDMFTITATAGLNGSISPSGAVPAGYGSSPAFTVSPDPGYHIDSVVVDGVDQGPLTSFTFTNVTAGHTIAAYFSIDTYTITASITGNGSINPSGVVTAAWGTDTTFTVAPAANHHVDSLVVDGVNLGPVTVHTFTNITTGHTLAAYVSIDTWTISASSTGNGSIAPSGAVTVPHGTDTTFAITPAVGWHVDSVLVDGVDAGAVLSYTFTGVVAGHTITAYFSIDMFTITATAGLNGSISPSGAVPASYGSSPSFTVAPDSGYHIDSVVVDGADQGPVTSFTFTNVTAAHSIAAYFSINTYTITATADPNGSIAPSGAVTVLFGGTQAFTAAPDSGFMVDSLVVDGVDQGPISLHTFTGVSTNHAIHASFVPSGYIITAAAIGGGALTPAGAVVVPSGGSQSFTVLPDPGYHTDSVVVDGIDQGVIPSYTFSGVNASHTITAYFSVNMYTIVATVSGNGTIAPADTVPAAYGSTPAFTITPATGHHTDSVLVDGVSQGAPGSYTFSAIDTNHTITAYFSINSYTVIAAVVGNGTIAPADTIVLTYGADQTFTISPATGHHVDSVLVDEVNQGAVTAYTFTAVDSNHAITAYVSIDMFPVVATAVGNGTIDPVDTVLVPFGGSQAFTVTADTGYHIDSVVVDGVDQGPVTSYTFAVVDTNHTITAYFSINYYSITTAVVGNGTISPPGTILLAFGTDTTVTVTPAAGYHVDSLVVDGLNRGPLAAFTFTGLSANHSVTAYISINFYAVTAIAGAGGTISPTGVVQAAYGGTLTFTIAPNLGRHVDSVLVDGVNQGPITTYTFLNIVANHTIRVWFSIDLFTITATADTQGVIVPSGVITVGYGSSRSFAISARRGYGVLDVLVDSISVGAVSNYTFVNVTAHHRIDVSFKQVNVFLTLIADSMLAKHPVTGRYWVPAKRYRGQYPSWANLLSEVVYQGGFQPGATESDGAGGMLLGVSYMFPVTPTIWKPIRDSAATMAWVRLTGWDLKKNVGKGYTALLKTLEDKSGRHDGEPRGLDYYGQPGQRSRSLIKQMFTIPPRKQDNALIPELVALKFNIAASQLGKTPPGFGELIYVNEGHPCDGMSIVAISAKTDTALTRWREYDDTLYTELYDAVYDINRAFVAPLDTFLFNNGGQLVVNGRVDVADVSFLRRDSTVAPRRLMRTNDVTEGEEEFEDAEFEDGMPVAAKLYQNYPNPFNPSTTINFRLREPSLVTVAVYNLLGQEVSRLLEAEELEEGYQTLEFVPGGLATGVYFCRIDVQGQGETGLRSVVTNKMLLLK